MRAVERGGDSYNYERWDAALGGIFTQLGIVRALSEGRFTPEELSRAVQKNDENFNEVLPLFPEDQRDELRKSFLALATQDTKAAAALRMQLGDLARYAGQRVRELAPSAAERQAIDAEREKENDIRHPTHAFLMGKEAENIVDRILTAVHVEFVPNQAVYIIGDLQRLLTIVEKLREKIDNEEIDVGGRDTDTCVEKIVAARDMLVRVLLASDVGLDSRQTQKLSTSDSDILDEAADIAGWLSVVRVTSV